MGLFRILDIVVVPKASHRGANVASLWQHCVGDCVKIDLGFETVGDVVFA